MTFIHPYAKKLSDKIARDSDHKIKIKARTLLNGFGYAKRTPGIIATIDSALSASGLHADLSTEYPKNIDDRITIRSIETSVSQKYRSSADHHKTSDFVDVAEKAVLGTVYISAELGRGAGFILDPDGLVVTAQHVVGSERFVQVLLADDREVEGVVFRSHRKLDFALIWLLGKGLYQALEIGDPKALRFGETVFAVGAPDGISKTVSRGIVSNPKQIIDSIEYIQTDTAIHYGNSGGPLINKKGVVGIVTMGRRDSHTGTAIGNANFAVPIDYLQNDIHIAVKEGKKKCLEAVYCHTCGYADYSPSRTWYCRNCGIELDMKTKRKKTKTADDILLLCDPHAKTLFNEAIDKWKSLGNIVEIRPTGICFKAIVSGRPDVMAILRPNLNDKPAYIILATEYFKRDEAYPPAAIEQFEKTVRQITPVRSTQKTTIVNVSETLSLRKIDSIFSALQAMIDATKSV